MGVDIGQAQHVAEEHPGRLGVFRIDDGMNSVDHPDSMEPWSELVAKGACTVVPGTDGTPNWPARREVVDRLRTAGCVAADEEADELLAAAPDSITLEAWLDRRERGEPLAWITGSQVFCGQAVRVDQAVYVPRPQSEDLARRAADVLAQQGGRAADLCTGAGVVARHLMEVVPTAGVVATDIDARAVSCARSNGVVAVQADLAAPFRSGAFAVVTAVPPYVPTAEMAVLPADVRRYEPLLALDGGHDGLDIVRRIIDEAARVLRPGGSLLLELGGDQDVALVPELTAAGWTGMTTWADGDGDLRGLSARAPSA